MKPVQITITMIAEDLFVVTTQDHKQILRRFETTRFRLPAVVENAINKLVPTGGQSLEGRD